MGGERQDKPSGDAETVQADTGPATATDISADRSKRLGNTTLSRGDSLGRFIVLDVIGEGGMGAVVSAHDPKLDRKVAIKVLRPFADLEGSKASSRLLREAQAMAKLQHSNVITVHEVGEHRAQVFIAMELIREGTLRQWLKREPEPTWRDIVAMFVQAGRGLAVAHRAGLVHRDFKPDNVLVTGEGTAKVTDFGLVSTAGKEAELVRSIAESVAVTETPRLLDVTLTKTGAVMGTPAYMSPEQHQGNEVDAKSDQFSFCVALWEALFHQRPFKGSTLPDLRDAAASGEIEEPKQSSRVPLAITRALRKGLSPNPDARHPSMDALLEVLSETSRPRARWVIPAVATLAVVAVAVAVFALRGGKASAAASCRGFDARLAGVWDGPTRAAVRLAFDKTNLGHSRETYGKVAALVGAYTKRWVAERTDACEATFVRHEQSDALLDRRMACYDRRLSQLRALTARLRKVDAKTAERSVGAAANLASISECGPDLQRDAYPLPTDPDKRARIKELQAQLDKAKTLIDLGKDPEYGKAVQSLLPRAEKLGFPPLLARTLLMLGEAQVRLGRPKHAEATLRRAAKVGATAKDDRLIANAQSWLVWVIGRDMRRPAVAEQLAAATEALLVRIGSPAKEMVHLYNSWSVVRGYNRRGLELARKALTWAKKAHGADHPIVAGRIINVGVMLRETGNAAEGLEWIRRGVDMTRRALGANHSSVAIGTLFYGLTHLFLGQLDKARASLNWAIDVLERSFGVRHPRVVEGLKFLVYSYMEDADPCLTTFKRLPDDVVTKDVELMALEAFCLVHQLRFAAGLALADKAVALARRSPDRPREELHGLHVAAHAAMLAGDRDGGLRRWRRTNEILEELRKHNPDRVGGRLLMAIRILEVGGLDAKMRAELRRVIEILDKAPKSQRHELAKALDGLGRALIGVDNAGAKAALDRAHTLAAALPINFRWEILSRVTDSLARLEMARAQWGKAVEHCNEAARLNVEHKLTSRMRAHMLCSGLAAAGAGRRGQAIRRLEAGLKQPRRVNVWEYRRTAELQFALAKLLWGEAKTRARAKKLATEARAMFAKLGPYTRKQHAAASRWLSR